MTPELGGHSDLNSSLVRAVARAQELTLFGLLFGILYQLVDGAARDRGAVASTLGSVEGPYGLRVLAYQAQHEINAGKGSAVRRSRCRPEGKTGLLDRYTGKHRIGLVLVFSDHKAPVGVGEQSVQALVGDLFNIAGNLANVDTVDIAQGALAVSNV
jgi:hypothetical protein